MTQAKRDRLCFLLAFFLPVLALLSYCIFRKIAPFGNGTFLIHDMNHQYADFFAYYSSVIRGENNWTYSLSRGMGGAFFPLWAYYLANPLDLIPTLLPDRLMPIGITAEMILLFGLTGLACFRCLVHFVPDGNRLCLLYLSTAYGLSGWMALNAENVQWLPAAAVLPLAAAALDDLKNKGKVLPAVMWLSAAIYMNFYMGYMLALFALIWLIIPEDKPAGPKIWQALLVTGLLTVPLLITLVPHILTSVKISASGWYQPALNFRVYDLLLHFLPGRFDRFQYMDNGLPAVYCGVLTVLLSALYWFRGPFEKVKRHRFLILLILSASLIFKPLTMVWQGFSTPHWWPYRFSFLFIFMIILTAAESRINVPWLILTICFAGLICNLSQTLSVKLENAVSADTYAAAVTEKRKIVQSITGNDPEFYRIEDLSPRSDNDPMHFSYAGITNFDSLARQDAVQFLKNLGFYQDRNTVAYRNGNTHFANSLMGIRYVLDNDTVHRNENPAGLAFITDAVLSDLSDPNAYALDIQNEIAVQLGCKSPVLVEIPYESIAYENVECSGGFCWKLEDAEPSYIRWTVQADQDIALYLHSNRPDAVGQMVLHTAEDDIGLDTSEYFIPMGNARGGEIITVVLEMVDPIADEPDILFIGENTDAVNQLFSELYDQISVIKNSSSNLNVHVPLSDHDRNLIVTVPYDQKWHAHSGNTPLETRKVWDLFLSVSIPAGIDTVDLSYR